MWVNLLQVTYVPNLSIDAAGLLHWNVLHFPLMVLWAKSEQALSNAAEVVKLDDVAWSLISLTDNFTAKQCSEEYYS